jgi:hypothetical protein
LTTAPNQTQNTVTTTNIDAKLNCAHLRLGVSSFTILVRELAMPSACRTGVRRARAEPTAGAARAKHLAVAADPEPDNGLDQAPHAQLAGGSARGVADQIAGHFNWF